jgi:hypothetical protein
MPNRATLNHALDSQVPTSSSSMPSPLTLSSSSTLRLHPPWFQILAFRTPETTTPIPFLAAHPYMLLPQPLPPPFPPFLPSGAAAATAPPPPPPPPPFSDSHYSHGCLRACFVPGNHVLPPPPFSPIFSLSLSSLVFRSATSTLSSLLLLPTPN